MTFQQKPPPAFVNPISLFLCLRCLMPDPFCLPPRLPHTPSCRCCFTPIRYLHSLKAIVSIVRIRVRRGIFPKLCNPCRNDPFFCSSASLYRYRDFHDLLLFWRCPSYPCQLFLPFRIIDIFYPVITPTYLKCHSYRMLRVALSPLDPDRRDDFCICPVFIVIARYFRSFRQDILKPDNPKPKAAFYFFIRYRLVRALSPRRIS